MTEIDFQILKSMETRGGNFVSSLAKAAYCADDLNLERIKIAFHETWEKHRRWSEESPVD
jgi:hypothetical protein